uniref:Uncharacterized protein n=1 Tax=Panagrolaimus sp. ES5 TaxID=591445 RepID=A0AC34FKZ0_9BILA
MHSSMAASPVVPSSAKGFMRLNTEKSRSVDRRPILAKAQSIAASAAAAFSSTPDSNFPFYVSNGTDVSNGEFSKNANGGGSRS